VTAQITDKIYYLGDKFSLVAVEKEWPFKPESHGMHPVPLHTACWRGFYCEYAIVQDLLVLNTLNIGLESPQPPVWMGITPIKDKIDRSWEYKGVHLPIEYSGGIVIGSSFLREFYVHMGFHQAYSFQNVYEIIFEQGKLIQTIDHCEQAERIRQMVKEKPPGRAPRKEIERFIEDSFSLSYDKKWF
jgi:hypothetical protein